MFRKKIAAAVLAAMAFVGMAVPAAAATDGFDVALKAAGLKLVKPAEMGQLGVDQGPFLLISNWRVDGVLQCLDLMQSAGDGRQIGVFDCHGNTNQYWYFNNNASTGHWEIKPYSFRTECADVFNSTGPSISRFPCRLTNNQLWEKQPTGKGDWYRYASFLDPAGSRNRCLDQAGDGTRRALLFQCTGFFNQEWAWAVPA